MSAAFPLKALLYPTDWISLSYLISTPTMNHFTSAQFLCCLEKSILSFRTVLLSCDITSEILPSHFLCTPSPVTKLHILFLFRGILDLWVFIFSSLSFIKWLYFNYLFLNVVKFFPAGSWLQFFLSSMWSLCWNNFYLIYFIYIIYVFYSFSLPLKYLPNNIYIFIELEDYLVMGSKMYGILGNVTFSCLLTYYQKLRLITL